MAYTLGSFLLNQGGKTSPGFCEASSVPFSLRRMPRNQQIMGAVKGSIDRVRSDEFDAGSRKTYWRRAAAAEQGTRDDASPKADC